MRIAQLNSLDVIVKGDDIFSLIREGDIIRLVKLKPSLEIADEVASFRGSNAFLLKAGKQFLVAVDNALILVENGAHKIVLRASRPENFFWHSTEADGYTFIQEYGHSPTYIYISEDLESWRRITSNVDLDKQSKHFHYIVWDPYRKWLIATLGDGCLTRAIYSEDLGKSWKPLYRGAWQFAPIVSLEDEVVFGMDSGIVRGGVGIYYPSKGRWKFIFLKWYNRSVRFAQMADLRRLSNGVWISALGTPQAILVSRDLKNWHPLHVEGWSESFNYHIKISEGERLVACPTGNSLLIFDKDKFEDVLNIKPVMLSYKAHIDRLKRIGFILKWRIIS